MLLLIFDSNLLTGALAGAGLLLLVLWLLFRGKESAGGFFETLRCKLKRFFRRGSWFLLFPVVVAIYPWFYNALLYVETHTFSGAERANSEADVLAKMVDPTQFYTKTWIALSNFCLINALGWASLLVVPVLVDWAVGFYKTPRSGFPVTFGFKGTFLKELTSWQRILIFVAVWALELAIAAHSVDSAFRMQ